MGCLICIILIPYYQGEQRDVITLTFKIGNGNVRISFSFPPPTAHTFYLISDRKIIFDSRSWRDGSQLKNTCYTSRGSKLCSQHHIGYLTRAIPPTLENRMPSAYLYSYCSLHLQTQYAYKHT